MAARRAAGLVAVDGSSSERNRTLGERAHLPRPAVLSGARHSAAWRTQQRHLPPVVPIGSDRSVKVDQYARCMSVVATESVSLRAAIAAHRGAMDVILR